MVQTKERLTERLLILVTPSEKLALQQMAEATDQSAGKIVRDAMRRFVGSWHAERRIGG